MQVWAESVSRDILDRDTLEPDPPGRGAPGADPEAVLEGVIEEEGELGIVGVEDCVELSTAVVMQSSPYQHTATN